ncbi:protoporphyrinogen oxidase (plasmid) [Halorussus salilacus]|uniref:protoporphyrinogen oxidase n=1 Tax=Halorussus salilacus TaxID=2953750 RepID=UPI0020A1AF17|nr:protoporphyrinogen oxidase [Halorussus salilacus]USZ69705.1 protoporphyrinogen oxidase [Halorussus salilacus]
MPERAAMTGERTDSTAHAERTDDADPRVGIVGGGITGLALAHYLDREGVEYVLYEAAPDPGGVIRSERVDGNVLERGPQRMRRTDRVDGMIRDLGLDSAVRTADPDLPVCVYADGEIRPAPFTPAEFAETDLLSAEGKRQVLAEPFTDPADPDETAEAMFVRKFGAEAYRNLLGPLFGGIYGSDPAEMPVEHALSGLVTLEKRHGSLLKAAIERSTGGRETPPAISFDDGLQRLPEALADAHAENVELGTPVTAVRESEDGGWELETPEGTTAVSEVVLTTPADLTADLVGDLAPDSAAALRQLNYNPLAMVYLRADLDAEGDVDPRALGYQVGFGEDLRTLGASWNASMFGREVYTVFLGGMHDPGIIDESDATLGEVASREFEAVTGAESEVVDVHRYRRGFPAYDDSWAVLDRVDLPDGVRLATNYTARMGVPSRIREAEALAETLAEAQD